jgi:hypothetical protein
VGRSRYRGSSAGARLLEAFIAYGKKNADCIVMTLQAKSPVDPRSLERKGFRLYERNFMLEVASMATTFLNRLFAFTLGANEEERRRAGREDTKAHRSEAAATQSGAQRRLALAVDASLRQAADTAENPARTIANG